MIRIMLRKFLTLACLIITLNVYALVEPDTFFVDHVPFSVTTPQNWIFQESNNGLCSDSTVNYIGHYKDDKIQQNVRIVVQIVPLTPQPYSNKKVKKKFIPTVTELVFQDVKGVEFNYPWNRKKKCNACGVEYFTLFATPLSDNRVLNIFFVGNGPNPWMAERQGEYRKFCKQFIEANGYGLALQYYPYASDISMCYTTTNLGGIEILSNFSNQWAPFVDTLNNKLLLRQNSGNANPSTILFSFFIIDLNTSVPIKVDKVL